MKISPPTLLKLRFIAVALGAWLALAVPASAQATPSAGLAPAGQPSLAPGLPTAPGASLPETQPVVEEIVIRTGGHQEISREDVMAHLELREKMTYSQELVQKSLEALNDTGLFIHVQSERELLPSGGVRVIFILVPKSRVSAVVFEGNEEYSKDRLSEEIKTVAGDVLDPAQVQHDKAKLFAFYQKKGYSRVKIEPDIKTNENTDTAVVTFKIIEGPDVGISEINFVGNDHIDSDTLADQMTTIPYEHLISFSRLPSWLTGSGRFEEEPFEDDLDKVRQYYKNKGFLDVDIPDSDVEFNYPAPDALVIVIHVHEGRQYHIGKITVSGNTIFQTTTLMNLLATRVMTPDKVEQKPIQSGDIFSPEVVDANADKLRDFYGASGYLETVVNPVRHPNLATGDIDLDFTIFESAKFYVASIDINGNTKTKSTVIVRELVLAPGDVFDTTRMKQSESRLRNLGYFNDPDSNARVNLAPEEGNIPGQRNLNITVKEGKTGNLNFGAGFDSVQSVVAYVEFSQSNFDLFNYRNFFEGGGEKARIRFTIGTELNSITLSFENPWLWERELDGGIDLFRNETSYLSVTFNETDLGFDVFLRKHLFQLNDGSYIDGTLTYTLEDITLSDVTTDAVPQIIQEQGTRSVSELSFDLTRAVLDNPVTPTEGTRLEFLNDVAGGPLAGQTNFYRVEARAGIWVPFSDFGSTFGTNFGNQVISFVARGGSIVGYGGKTVPYAEKYFLGGGYNLRGYSYRNVGPHESDPNSAAFGQPLGGDTFVYASPEYSIEVFHPVRFAVFYDMGYVNQDSFNFSPNDFHQDVGIGFRILLFGAPLRIDFGYPLNPDPFQSHGIQFNFSFGTVF